MTKNLKVTIRHYLIVFFCSFLFLLLSMNRIINVHDEGLILTGAMRVAAGDMPHRDFYANYGPAQFYILAFLFNHFGQWVGVARLYDVAVRAMILTACYGAIAPYCRRFTILVAMALCAAWLVYLYFSSASFVPAMLLSMLSSLLIIPVLSRNASRWRMAAAGALTGLAFLFRYDSGVCLAAAHAGAIAIIISLQHRPLNTSIRAFIHLFLPYAVAFMFLFIPAVLWYWKTGAIEPFIRDIIVYPSSIYPRTRGLPFPTLSQCEKSFDWFSIYAPIAVIAAMILDTITDRANAPLNHPSQRKIFLIVFSMVTIAMYSRTLVRPDWMHVIPSLIPSILIAAVLFECYLTQSFAGKLLIGSAVLLLEISTLPAFYHTIAFLITNEWYASEEIAARHNRIPDKNTDSWCDAPAGIPRISCFFLEPDRLESIRFIIRHTAPGERIFIGLNRHDKIKASNVALYFAAGRLPATKWHQLDPGLQTTADIQNEMIHELDVQKIRYIVLDSQWDDVKDEPNDSAKSSGVTLLDDYIRQNYTSVKQFGTLSVWLRNSGI